MWTCRLANVSIVDNENISLNIFPVCLHNLVSKSELHVYVPWDLHMTFHTYRMFTETALAFSTGILNAFVDLVSFSGILYTIYPPLFLALLVYSVGGTAISLQLGKPLVGLNFRQEAREADFRWGFFSLSWEKIFQKKSRRYRAMSNSSQNGPILLKVFLVWH